MASRGLLTTCAGRSHGTGGPRSSCVTVVVVGVDLQVLEGRAVNFLHCMLFSDAPLQRHLSAGLHFLALDIEPPTVDPVLLYCYIGTNWWGGMY